MILDQETIFGDSWAPTATGDNFSTNVLDLGPFSGTPSNNTGRDLGVGQELWLEVLVQTAVTSAGAATVEFRFVTDSQTSMATCSTLVSSGVLAKTTLTAGYTFRTKLPSGTYKRYVAVNANIGTAVLTAGAFQAKLVQNVQINKAYAGSFSMDV